MIVFPSNRFPQIDLFIKNADGKLPQAISRHHHDMAGSVLKKTPLIFFVLLYPGGNVVNRSYSVSFVVKRLRRNITDSWAVPLMCKNIGSLKIQA